MSLEKRQHERVVARYPVQICVGEEATISGTVENLGALGALISTVELEPPLDIGSELDLTIAVSGKGAIEVSGKILRVDQEFVDGEVRRAFAVRFDQAIEI